MLQDPQLLIHRLRLRYLSQIEDGFGERVFDFSNTRFQDPAIAQATEGFEELIERCYSPDIPIHEPQEYPIGRQARGTVAGLSTIDGSPTSTAQQGELGTLLRTFTEGTLRQRRRVRGHHRQSSIDAPTDSATETEPPDRGIFSDGDEASRPETPRDKHMVMLDLHKRLQADDRPSLRTSLSVRRRGISDPSLLQRNDDLPLPPKIGHHYDSDSALDKLTSASVMGTSSSQHLTEASQLDDLGLRGEPQSGVVSAMDVDYLDLDAIRDLQLDESDGTISDGDGHDIDGNTEALSPFAEYKSPDELLPQPAFVQKILPLVPKRINKSSALTSMIKASKIAKADPLEESFGMFNGKGEPKPLRLKIYRPTSDKPRVPFTVTIRNVATVVETIGYALLCYSQEGLTPPLADEMKDPNKWTLRIVEEDGELDDDFPALERTRPISKFSFDEFAIVEATPAQAVENQSLTPSPIKASAATSPAALPVGRRGDKDDLTLSPPPSMAEITSSIGDVTPLPGSLAASMKRPAQLPSVATLAAKPAARAPGAPVLLKVRLKPDSSEPSIQHGLSTILDVTTETYIGEVLDQVCKRRNLDKYMYTLRIVGTSMIAPSDRTIESLQGRNELVLVRKKATDVLAEFAAPRSLTPNAPIVVAGSTFKGPKLGESSLRHEVPDLVTSSMYQAWTVWRRQTVAFMGRHERVLAIDGEHIQLSPTDVKAMFETPKTSTIHGSQVVACKQSSKMPTHFKFIILRQGQTKRYDFEATNRQEAEAIVARIRSLVKSLTGRSQRNSRLT